MSASFLNIIIIIIKQTKDKHHVRPEVVRPEVVRAEVVRTKVVRTEVIRTKVIHAEVVRALRASGSCFFDPQHVVNNELTGSKTQTGSIQIGTSRKQKYMFYFVGRGHALSEHITFCLGVWVISPIRIRRAMLTQT